MGKVTTVSISLGPQEVEELSHLARTTGSRSAAIRHLLRQHERLGSMEEIESAYREYFEDPQVVEENRKLTEQLLSASSWLRPQSTRDTLLR
jgi:hypothetical protein